MVDGRATIRPEGTRLARTELAPCLGWGWMMAGAPLVLYMDDVVRLRKPHPCGSFEWTVVRLGADIGLRCLGCGRKVLLPRRTVEKRLKTFVRRGPGAADIATERGSIAEPADAASVASRS